MERAFKSMDIEEVRESLASFKLPKFRATQILDWVYAKNVGSYDEMTNLPQSMRTQLADSFPLYKPQVINRQISQDSSRKYLFEFHDGSVAESVGLPSEDQRLTVCISSQSGCAMRCAFCATGRQGLTRDLLPGELADQVLGVQEDFGMRVTNVVIMGQGEPFANYANTMAGLKIINDRKLIGIGARHITVSTCGLIKGIEQFSQEDEQFTLAISLHSARQAIRDELMPKLSNQPLEKLRQALVSYNERTGRRFSFEYALMKGINDGQDDLDSLISYCQGLLCHVNLIPLNEIEESPFKPVPNEILRHWKEQLEKHGTAASVRRSRGSDIAAACGQLASRMGNLPE